MIVSLAISSLICFFIAINLNLLLLYLILFRPSIQLTGYKWISIGFIITDLVFSSAYSIIVPLWHAENGLILLIPVGFTSSLSPSSLFNSLIRPAFTLWHAGMMGTSFLVAATFIYRYNVICRSNILSAIFDSRIAGLLIVLLCLSISLTHGLILDTFTSPISRLTKTLNKRVGKMYDQDFSRVYYQGVDRTDSTQHNRETISVIESGIFQLSFIIMLIIVLITGSKMYSAIKAGSYSQKAKERQMHMFKMLVAQTVSPLLFLYLPPIIDVSSLTFDYFLPFSLCFLKALLVFMFPIANPLIIILFTDDYKKFIFRQNKRSTLSLSHASNVKQKISVVKVSKFYPN